MEYNTKGAFGLPFLVEKMALLVLKTGERLKLDLDSGDANTIMNSQGVVQIDDADGNSVYLRAEDVLYIREENEHEGSNL